MNPVRIYELDTAWNRRFSGSAEADKGRRGDSLVFLQISILMGDWCRQDGHCKPKRNYGIGKEVDGSIEIILSKKQTESSVERWG